MDDDEMMMSVLLVESVSLVNKASLFFSSHEHLPQQQEVGLYSVELRVCAGTFLNP